MAKMRNLLAFDLGASNGRAILGQFDGEKITMTELHRFENNYVEMNGVFYWDTPYLYNQLKKGLMAFKQGGYGDLDSFGIDTWGVDYGLLRSADAIVRCCLTPQGQCGGLRIRKKCDTIFSRGEENVSYFDC